MSEANRNSSPDGRYAAVMHALWVNHALAMVALLVAGFVLVSWWHEAGAAENADLLMVGAWAVMAVAFGAQLFFRPARGDVVLSAAAVLATAGALSVLASLFVAGEGAVHGLLIASIIAFGAALAIFVAAVVRRRRSLK